MDKDITKDCEKFNKIIEQICEIINKNDLTGEEVFHILKCFLLGFLSIHGIKTKEEALEALNLEGWQQVIAQRYKQKSKE